MTLQGHHLSAGDAIWALETCGVHSDADLQFSKHSVTLPQNTSVSGFVSTLQLEHPLPVAAGRLYKLCWCGAGCPCSSVEDLSVEAGELTLQGPSSSEQHRTCVSGRTCAVEGLQGEGLSDYDSYLIQDTCGSDQILEAAANAGKSVQVLASGAVVRWDIPHTFAGGLYQLCWCGAATNVSTCTTGEEHLSTVGSLALRGPAPLEQDRTCISGHNCKLKDFAGYLMDWSGDAVMVLSTCSLPQESETRAELETGGVLRFGLSSLVGGIYRLCWCGVDGNVNETAGPLNRTSCLLAEDFHTDFGSLHVVGPAASQADATCVSGRACRIWHISGHLLDANSSHLLILDTCAKEMQTPTSFRPSTNVSAPFSVDEVPVIGGQYRLCWCGGTACVGETAFHMDVARVTVVGPNPLQQDRTCISGRMCSVEGILGVGLSSGDKAMILDTCGVRSHTNGLPNSGVSVALSNTSQFAWSTLSAKGGQYRLCWCAEEISVALATFPTLPEMHSLTTCATATDFNVDFGQLELVGPLHPDQQFTCVSGQTCTLRGPFDDASSEDAVLVLDSCGSATSSVPGSPQQPAFGLQGGRASFSWGAVRQTMQGGEYRLCWCSTRLHGGVNLSAVELCQTSDQFIVSYGQLQVVGPSLNHVRTCVAGWPCQITGLHGTHLQAGDSYLILDTCGLASHIPRSPSAFKQLSSGTLGTVISFTTPVTSNGGSYRICWCGAGFPCSDFDAFRVDAGELVVQGTLSQQSFTCVRGTPCKVSHVQGLYVEGMQAEFVILDTCASNEPLVPTTGALVQSVPGTAALWEISLTVQGGAYRLCWCADLQQAPITFADNSTMLPSQWEILSTNASLLFNSTLQNRSLCTRPDHRVDVGELHLLGPATEQKFTCISGRSCLLDSVLGLGLTVNDSYLVLDTCGIPSVIPRFSFAGQAEQISASGAIVSWHEPVTAAAGQYRLCWCHQSNASSCNAVDFLSDVGSFSLLGVAPLTQDRTCVSGQPCAVDGITGMGLRAADALLVMETCRASTAEAFGASTQALSDVAWELAAPRAGGEYRLCWCSGAESNASNANATCLSSDFRVDVGRLYVQGPAPLQQRYTCISGRACNLDGVGGEGLHQDSLMILDTCGIPAGQMLQWAELTNYTAYGASVARLGLEGGRYQLCWCPDSMTLPMNLTGFEASNVSNTCQTSWDFTVSFGHLDVVGVSPLSQDRTCISGQTCQIDGMGGLHLSQTDLWLVLETCGGPSEVSGIPGDNHTLVDVQGDLLSTATVTWDIPFTARGGSYRMCWCSRPENSTDASLCLRDSQIDVGKLEVIGPSGRVAWLPRRGHCGTRPEHPALEVLEENVFTNLTMDECSSLCNERYPYCLVAWFADRGPNEGRCIIMHSCALIADDSQDTLLLFPRNSWPDVQQARTCVSGQVCTVQGLQGNGLSTDDVYMVLNTCGLQDALVERIGRAAVALSFPSGDSNSSGIDVIWEGRLSAPGGSYRLCWCTLSQCGSAEAFRTDVGALMLTGPSPLQQHRTCVSGSSCVVDGIQGQGLADGDGLWILDTCGTAAGKSFIFSESWLAQPAVASGTSFFWNPLDTLPGGQYRLCWCGGRCATSWDFWVDLGELLLQGPTFSHQTCVSGQSCRLEGLGSSESLLLMETCGLSEAWRAASSAPDIWELTAPGGQYQLCWCKERNHSGNASNPCLASWDFTMPFGSLTVVGPRRDQRFTCISGQTCLLAGVSGEGLLPGDAFLALDTCGLPSTFGFGPSSTLASWTPEGNGTFSMDWSYPLGNLSWTNQSSLACSGIACRSTEPVLGVAWYEALTIAGGIYQLCWCAAGHSCGTAESFSVSSGTVMVRGPAREQDRTCVSGQVCSFGDIGGTHMHLDDKFMILETCGSPFLPRGVASLGFIDSNATDNSTNMTGADLARVTWGPDPFSGPGGVYRLCWCAAGFDCESGLNFRTDVGMLFLVGPSANFNQYDAWLRGNCIPQEPAYSYDNMSKTQCFDLGRRAGPDIAAAQVYQQENITTCTLLRSCDSLVSSDAAPYELLLLSSRFSQHRTCVSGRSCSIDAIEGLGLATGDSFVVLDTCGTPLLVEGMPTGVTTEAVGAVADLNFSAPSVLSARLCFLPFT